MAWIGGCGLCSPHTALPCSETRLPRGRGGRSGADDGTGPRPPGPGAARGASLPFPAPRGAAGAPGPGRGQTCWSSLCVHSLGGWALSSTTGMPGRQPRVWRHLALTWPHLPPCVLTRADRPTLPWRLWGSGWLSFFLPFWEAYARPGSPPPAARWAAGPAAHRPGRSGPVAEVQAGLQPSPLVACGRSYWGRGNGPG